MDSITLENYRCFREKQTARLAPLTLLVGENSTGKTSFLALIRALWDVAIAERVPDFREEPYDLGSFREIAHDRGSRGSRADSFEVSLANTIQLSHKRVEQVAHRVTFTGLAAAPYPVERRFYVGQSWFALDTRGSNEPSLRVSINSREIKYDIQTNLRFFDNDTLFPLGLLLSNITRESTGFFKLVSNGDPEDIDYEQIDEMGAALRISSGRRYEQRPFASAPVHARPHRTYDPSRPARDPEGESTPSYLAELFRRNPSAWNQLKKHLEAFGHASGLFDEISIRSFGHSMGSPFQVEIRKFDRGMKGPQRNLIDVGYGVSQTLPMLTEFFREDSPRVLLLQQPEVHLHPSAQAALGSLFCTVSGPAKQLIVETHSDYIVDRVRMGVRDKIIRSEDISILFFERTGLDVKIHSLRIDELGNVLNAPPSYGQFFMEELDRSVGL